MLPITPFARVSPRRPASSTGGGTGRAARSVRARPRLPRRSAARRVMRDGDDRRGVRLFGDDTCGAKVEGVELGFSALRLETAEAAALGLEALGLPTSEAAALGLVEFGPDTVGAEPGVGDDTPPEICASAALFNPAAPVARPMASAISVCRSRPEPAMASSRQNCRPWSTFDRSLGC